MITLSEAAALLDTSRPNMTALCDAGRLGPVETCQDGRRGVQRPEMERYAAGLAQANAGAMSPREAGMAADIYRRIKG